MAMTPPQQNPQLLNEIQSEVSTEAAPLLQFILKHAAIIISGLVLFVLVLAGVGGYNWYTGKQLEEAHATLQRISFSTDDEQRITALEQFLATAPESLKNATLLTLAEEAMSLDDYTKAADYFGKLASHSPDSAAGRLAALNQGQALILGNKAKDAIPVLEALLARLPQEQRSIVLQALAEACLQDNDNKKAAQYYEDIAKISTGPEASFFLFRARNTAQNAPK